MEISAGRVFKNLNDLAFLKSHLPVLRRCVLHRCVLHRCVLHRCVLHRCILQLCILQLYESYL